MFSIEQIKTAHAKVKSGADFPAYIQELIQLGVVRYDSLVNDGHSVFKGKEGYKIESVPMYPVQEVAEMEIRNSLNCTWLPTSMDNPIT